ncbi:MAG: response regulator [Acidobacteriota bacterium]
MEKKILVVDDDPAIRTLLCTVLRRQGLQVESAVDGLDALKKVRTLEGIALILLDVMMPNLDGPGFVTALRESNLGRLPMIVVITAGHEIGLERLDRQLVAGILRKPFDIFEVASMVNEALSAIPDDTQAVHENAAPNAVLLTTGLRLSISASEEESNDLEQPQSDSRKRHLVE